MNMILREIAFNPEFLGNPGIYLRTANGETELVKYEGRSKHKEAPYNVGGNYYNKDGKHVGILTARTPGYDLKMFQDMTPQQVTFELSKVGNPGVTVKTTGGDPAELVHDFTTYPNQQYPLVFKVKAKNRTYKANGKWHSDTNRQNLDLVMYQSPKQHPAPNVPVSNRNRVPFSVDNFTNPNIITERRDGQQITNFEGSKRHDYYSYSVNGPLDYGRRRVNKNGIYFNGIARDGRITESGADLIQFEVITCSIPDKPAAACQPAVTGGVSCRHTLNVADLVQAVADQKAALVMPTTERKEIQFDFELWGKPGIEVETTAGEKVTDIENDDDESYPLEVEGDNYIGSFDLDGRSINRDGGRLHMFQVVPAQEKHYREIPFNYTNATKEGVIRKTADGQPVEELVYLAGARCFAGNVGGKGYMFDTHGAPIFGQMIQGIKLYEEVKPVEFYASIDTIGKTITIEDSKGEAVKIYRQNGRYGNMAAAIKITATQGNIISVELVKPE